MTATPTAGSFQTGFAIRPDLLVEARGAADVRAAVRDAAAHGRSVAVRATGHGLPGPVEGGVLIDTRRMDTVEIDPVRRTARIGAGATWGRVVEAAARHGLAPLNGSAPGVGAVSYTLGGGLGILGREFGYAADHVRALDVVTADGVLHHVTPDAEPDLFWGLRGGGHRLGAVTELETGLVAVDRLYGGSLAFDGAAAPQVLRHYLEWTRTVPDTCTSSLAALSYPDVPQMPQALRGRYAVSVRVAYTGSAVDGEALVAPLRAIGPALSDSLREMPYTESHTIHSDPPFPHAYYGEGLMLRELDAGSAARVLELTGPTAPMMTVVQINHLGGALASPPPAGNAVPHREAGFLLRLLAMTAGTDVAAARHLFARAAGETAPHGLGPRAELLLRRRGPHRGLHGPGTREARRSGVAVRPGEPLRWCLRRR